MTPVWTSNPEGEYNEESCTLPDGRKLTIYSDRDGERWEAYEGEAPEDALLLDAENIRDARTEALKWVS